MADKAQTFVKHFTPYRGRYTMQGRSPLFDEPCWFTRTERLTGGVIAKAILERLVVGWFTTYVPRCLGVDVDDHRGRAWTGRGQPSAYLLAIYDQVVARLGCRPSLLLQSPRGLHGYWILSERMPAEILHAQASARLAGLPVEIRPTPTTALRIPAERRLMDPATFQLLSQPFEAVLDAMPIYHPVVVFYTIPEEIRQTLLTKRRKLRSFRAVGRVEDAERSVHFYAGQSNAAFLELCNVYRCAGLDEDEALYRFQLKLEQSPLYDGELRQKPGRLLQRIRSEYRGNPYTPQPREVQLGLFNGYVVGELVARHPFARQRTAPIRRFLDRVLLWCDWHDDILQDRGRTAVFDYLFTYYRKNRRAGYYPLPYTFLRKANSQYASLMPWLQAEGFIEPAPYGYSTILNVCKYYKVQREGFLMREVRRQAGDSGVRAAPPS